MKLFSHTFANYTCPQCHHGHQVVSANLNPFVLGSAVLAALAIHVRLSLSPDGMPWYYFISILAGELLLLWFSGNLAAAFTLPFQREPRACPGCGGSAKRFFAGRYFKPSAKAHWTDWVDMAAFFVANVILWCLL